MPRAQEELDLLSSQLRRAQAEYEWARSRGDTERLAQLRLKIARIKAEYDRRTNRKVIARPAGA